ERAREYGRLMRCCLGIAGDSNDGRLSAAVLPYRPLPEKMQEAYPLSKRALRAYEREVSRSQKPDFPLGNPVEPLDVVIAATRDINRKSEKPLKKQMPIAPRK